jgi:DNA-binding NtrC family response regulator
MRRAIERMEQVAPTDLTVLITGESGTGKEVFARAIHSLSRRRKQRLVSVNCGAIPENLLEAELFGNEKGAYTGAVEQRKGFFEVADKGTIFLDELGEMLPATQVKLLRVLETGEFSRLGSSAVQTVDVRVIAATNRRLEEEVASGRFRRDLYYRLNTVQIYLPPLREHPEDIPPLVDFLARQTAERIHVQFHGIDDDALRLLMRLPWQGNVRELRNTIEAVVTLERGRRITADMLRNYIPLALPEAPKPQAILPVYVPSGYASSSSDDTFNQLPQDFRHIVHNRAPDAASSTADEVADEVIVHDVLFDDAAPDNPLPESLGSTNTGELVASVSRQAQEPLHDSLLASGTDASRALVRLNDPTSEQMERAMLYQAIMNMAHELSALREEVSELKTILLRDTALTNLTNGEASNELSSIHEQLSANHVPFSFDVPTTPGELQHTQHQQYASVEHGSLRLDIMEQRLIIAALERFAGNRRLAANALGVSERTLYRKLHEYNLLERFPS